MAAHETKTDTTNPNEQGILRRRWTRTPPRHQGRAQDRPHARHADLHLEELQSRRRKGVAIESAAAEASYRSSSAFAVLGKTHEHDHARWASTITGGPRAHYFSRVT